MAGDLIQVPNPGQGLTAFAYEQVTGISGSSALTAATAFPSGAAPAKAAVVHVQGGAVRYRPDGTAPTTTVGLPLAVDTYFVLTSAEMIKAALFIEAVATSILNVVYYR